MATIFDKIPIGILNPLQLNTNTLLFDSRQDSSVNHLRKVMREVSNPNNLDTASGFIGVVLYIKPKQAATVEKVPGSSVALIENATNNKNLDLTQIIVRVPELHAFIPEPLDESDSKNIVQHPVFTAINDTVPVPKVGDLVVVDFKNKANRTDGIYITKVKDSQPGNGSTSSGASAQQAINGNQPYIPAKGAKLNYSINTTPPPQVTGHGVTINGKFIQAPPGINIVPFNSPDGFPSNLFTTPRKEMVYQFILHRGPQNKMKKEKWPEANLRILNKGRGLSTTFSMALDGTIYQHFDPALYAPRATANHNSQSDSFDICGPFNPGKYDNALESGTASQKLDKLKIGNAPAFEVYTMSEAQSKNLAAFLSWYLPLRGIEKRVCTDFTSRGTPGTNKDPVQSIKGLLAHVQIASPGTRADGAQEIKDILPYLQGFQFRKDLFG